MVIRTVARHASSPLSGDWNLAPWTRFCLTKYPMLARKPQADLHSAAHSIDPCRATQPRAARAITIRIEQRPGHGKALKQASGSAFASPSPQLPRPPLLRPPPTSSKPPSLRPTRQQPRERPAQPSPIPTEGPFPNQPAQQTHRQPRRRPRNRPVRPPAPPPRPQRLRPPLGL
jgi:hypothetical protein